MDAESAIVQVMTTEEARQCADQIRRSMSNIGQLLLDFYEREGWRALGYDSWRECAMTEFGYGQSRVYQLLEAARVERNISTIVEMPVAIVEAHLRPLTPLDPPAQREIWQRVVETAPDGVVTAKHVERTVIEWKADNKTNLGDLGSKHIDVLATRKPVHEDGDLPDTVTLRVARVVYLMALGRHMDLAEIASLTGLTENGAWRLMNRLAGGHHVPVTEFEGHWCILDVGAGEMAY